MANQTQVTPWQHCKTTEPRPRSGWELTDSNGDWLVTFRREGDCLLFMGLAGPKPSPAGETTS